jgi:hypothetical protein
MIVEVSKWKSGISLIERLPQSSTAHPPSVWLYYSTKAAAVAELSQNMIQRTLSDDEYVRLVDARTGDSVRICTSHFEQSSDFTLPMIRIKLLRALRIGPWSGTVKVEYGLSHDGRSPQLLLLNFLVPQEAQKKGLATLMFAAHVQAARAFGFEQIIAYAVGGKGGQVPNKNHSDIQQLANAEMISREEQDTRNGYYTWPRLGFDTRLTAEEKARLSPAFGQLSYLREVLERPEGRYWWREHGFAVEVTFDTSPYSRSVQRLQAALVELDQKNACWDCGQDMPLRIERGPTLRPRRDWRQRIWEYRQQECFQGNYES